MNRDPFEVVTFSLYWDPCPR